MFTQRPITTVIVAFCLVLLLSLPALAATTPNQLAGGVVINEILADPNGVYSSDTDGDGFDEADDEFVELYNVSGAPIDISGFELYDAVGLRATIPASTVLAAGDYIAIIADIGDGAPGLGDCGDSSSRATIDANASSFLNNGGDAVALYDPGTQTYIAASYNGYTDPAAVPGGATQIGTTEPFGDDVDGLSLVRDPAGDTNIRQHYIDGTTANNASPGCPTPAALAVSVSSSSAGAAATVLPLLFALLGLLTIYAVTRHEAASRHA